MYLAGFSQGSSLSISTFLTYPERVLGGVMGLSGILPLYIQDWNSEIDLKLKRESKLWFYHGLSDNTVPIENAKLSLSLLDKYEIPY